MRGDCFYESGVVVALEPVDGICTYSAVEVEVGLELSVETVLLGSYHFVAFVYGEVEVRHQLSVCPGGVETEVVVELGVSWHEVDDDPYAGYCQQCFYYVAFLESYHFV